MRVLVVHNRYRGANPSGENNVVDTEVDLLRSAGVDVHTFIRSSDEIAVMPVHRRVGVALSPITGAASRESFRDALHRVRPAVVHLHNPYPLISPTVIDESRRAGAAVVATVHNYRFECMNGLLFRAGAICTDCEGRRVQWPGVQHSCYRGSFPQSAVMAVAIARHRPAWEGVGRFLAVSDFVADRLRRSGVPAHSIVVKPNATPDHGVADEAGSGFLFAGRLSAEKGVHVMLDAWGVSGLGERDRLVIVGDGPLRKEVEARTQRMGGVTFVGGQTPEQVRSWRAATAVGVFPSLWYETLSAAPESFACGRPVVATRLGGLGAVVDDDVGWTCEPDADALAAVLVAASDPRERSRRGLAARARFDQQFAPDVLLRRQLGAYEAAIAERG